MRSSTTFGRNFFHQLLLPCFFLASMAALAQPTTQATNLVFNNGGSTTSLNISWTNGNGSNRLVVITAANGVFTPVNATDYTADVNANYSTAIDKDGGAGIAKIVYNGSGTSVNVSGLAGNTHYRVRIYEFAAAGFLYNTTVASGSFQGFWYYTNPLSAGGYTVPVGATNLNVQAWGGGGGGGNQGNGASGGGGGAYASGSVPVSFGNNYSVTIGVGGAGGNPNPGVNGGNTIFGSNVIVAAGGSSNNADVSGALGGTIAGSIGTVRNAGGNGGNGGPNTNEGGGGGGSSATSSGNGVNGGNFSGNQGGAFGNGADGDGGEGGDDDGATSPNTAGNGTFPGGGGGGRGDANGGGGSGASGLLIVSYEVDSTPPAILTVGAVTATGGNVVTGFYNNTNTGISIDIPLGVDPTLVGGNIQIRIDDDGNSSYNDVGTAVAITADNTTQVVTLTEAQLTATSEFANPSPNPITFTAIITDAAGNSVTYTVSASTITRNETAPATPSVPDLIVASDTGLSTTDNVTNDNTPTFDVNSNTAGVLLEILANGTVVASNASSTGAVEQLTATTLADNTYTIAARVTNAAGSQSTSANLSPNLQVDTGVPAAPTGLDLTTDSGISNTDDITNDNTPSFSVTGTTGLRLEILDGSTVVATAASATGSAQSLTTSTLSDGVHSITARTSDLAGNSASTSALSVTIDTQAPTVSAITPGVDPSRGFIPKTGSVNIANGATSGTGTGTLFTTELFPGATIRDASGSTTIAGVVSITNDTQITTTTAGNAINGSYSIRLFFDVTFSEPIDASTITNADFVKGTGTAGGTIISNTGTTTVISGPPIIGSPTSQSFRVSVDANGTGTWRLDKTNNSYSDIAGNASTATFTTGTVANIDNTAPAVVSINRKTPAAAFTQATSVTYTVTFAEAVTGVDPTDFFANVTGVTAGAITVTPVSPTVYDVDVASISAANGTLRLDVVANATIQDALGNTFGSTAYTGGQVYTFDYTNPAQPATYNALTLGGNIVTNYWNSHNTSVRLVVAIPNDLSLSGGAVQVEARVASGTFATIASTSSLTITGPEVNNNKNIDIDAAAILGITGYAQGEQLQFQVRLVDLVGNIGPYRQSTNSLTVDTVKPTISGSPIFALNGNSRETIVLNFSETLALTNGVLPVRTATSGQPGFYSDQPFIRNNAAQTFYTTVGNTITLSSEADANWTTAVQITYTANVGTAGNYVRDAAGNEMNTVTFPVIAPAPLIFSSMVLNPNGASGEIITFTVDQTLTTTTAANGVTGITVNGLNTGFTATYSTVGNIITLVAAANNTWNETATVSYSGGNLTTGTAMAAFGPEPILFGPVTIASNNSTNTAFATTIPVGNTITITFRANAALLATPTVTIGGLAATVSGTHPNYTATVTATNAIPQGVVAISITGTQSNRSTTTTFTTNSSTVTFDNIVPSIPTAPDLAAADDSGISNSDNITANNTNLDFTGTAEANSTVRLFRGATQIAQVSATGGGAYTFTSISLPEGFHNLTVRSIDQAGNFSTSPILKVKIDTTPPTLLISSIIASTGGGANQTALNGIGVTQGITGNVPTDLYFKATFLEEVYDVAVSDFSTSLGSGSSITSLGVLSLTPDVGNDSIFFARVSNASGTGTITLDLKDNGTIFDLAGNAAAGGGDFVNTFSGTNYFTLALPEPTNEPFSVLVDNVTGNSITVEWNSSNTAEIPTHFLILAKTTTGGSYPTVVDGTYIANSLLAQNAVRLSGTNTYTFTGLNSGTSYDFIVYKYTLASNNSNDNINFETAAPAILNGIETTTASNSFVSINSTPVPISSIKNTNLNSENVFGFKVWDDGQSPLATGMRLKYNGTFAEQIVFNLRDELTLAEGAIVTGFTTSSGALASAIYTGKGTTNTITLNSTFNNAWNTGTTVTYSGTGNAQFVTLGAMQPVIAHSVDDNLITQTFLSNGSFVVPASITNITVEAWGGGGSAGGLTSGLNRGGGGGGGAYSRSTLSVSPGNNYGVTVGLGATCCFVDGQPGGTSSFGGLVVAVGGNGGFAGDSGASGGAGGSALSGIGNIRFSGGSGGSGIGAPSGGGGGSSAGTSSSGNSGTSTGVPGSAPIGGGAGGAGSILGAGANGQFPGGGGGGTGGSPSGLGANGQIIVTYDDPTLPPAISGWAGDNAPFKFSQLVINQGTGNSALLANWQDILAGAELFDGTNAVAGTINTNNITFAAIPSATATDVGFVADATVSESFKNYTLRIWLRNNLSNTIANAVDGLNLAFRVDAAGFSYNDVSNNNQKSSRLIATQPTIQSGSNTIDVQATKLVFNTAGTAPVNTNPQAQIGVLTPFAASSAQDPEVYALDANNNRDLGYNNSANITNPLQGFGQSTPSLSFNSGVLSLNPFYFTTGATTVQNTQLVVAGTGLPAVTSATSTNVASIISTRTTITAATGGEPATLSSLTTALFGAIPPQLNAVSNFNFILTDDNAADNTTFTDNDGLPTRFNQLVIGQGGGNDAVLSNWTNAIASAQLVSGLSTITGTVGATTITFAGIPNTVSSDLGFITDGASKTYTLRIALRNPVDNSIADLIDNKDFVFSVSTSNISVTALNTTSTIQAAQSENSGNGNNAVAVVASKLDFITPVSATQTPATPQNYDANIDFDDATGGTQQGLIKARDVNQNLDLDINSGLTLSTFDFFPVDGRTYPLNNNLGMTFSSGQVTLNNNLQVSSSGGGFNNDQTYLVASTGAISGNSNTFTINYSGNSDIALASFSEPTNILYAAASNQVTDITAATGVIMQQFTIRDGGGSPDADGTATTLGTLTLNFTNHANIRRVALYNALNLEVIDTTSAIFDASGNIILPNLGSRVNKISAVDNGSTTFSVKISFNSTVTDNQVINVRVVLAQAAGVSSSFNAGTNSTTFPTLATDANQIEVVATQLDFTTIPAIPLFTASISVPLTPQVVVTARDGNTSIDLDYNGTISSVSNSDPLNFNTINNPSGSFSGGQRIYPANFQFDIGNGNVQLTISAGAGSGPGVNAGALSGVSNFIKVESSFESVLASGFQPALGINYEDFQVNPIANYADGFTIDSLRLSDGLPINNYVDSDGANTVLSNLELAISNYQAIRSIAIFKYDPEDNATTFVAETSTFTNSGFGYGTVTFSGLNITAEDKATPGKLGYADIIIKASFKDDIVNIIDNKQIQVAVINAATGVGSKFRPAPLELGNYIGGFIRTSPTLPDATQSVLAGAIGARHYINVVATSLDFEAPGGTSTQPSAFAGKNEPIVTGNPQTSPNGVTAIIYARDKFGILDTDFGSPASVFANATPILVPNTFSNGILNLIGMRYQNAGDGTLRIVAGSLDSDVPPAPADDAGNHTPSTPVSVLHVTAAHNTQGVELNESLKGGTTGKRIFGVEFSPESNYKTGSEPNLTSFSIVFRNDANKPYPYKTGVGVIFKNFKLQVIEGSGSLKTLTGGGVDYTLVEGQTSDLIALVGSNTVPKDKLTFNLQPASYGKLWDKNYKYYLVVDVDVDVNVGTPPITPYVVDDGFGTPATNLNIVTTVGSSSANVKGITRKFASTKPPALTYTYPANGQLNVNPGLDSIMLVFDVPVTTFDHQIELYERASGNLIATLNARNGKFPKNLFAQPRDYVVDTLLFDLGTTSLIPDSVYFIRIAKGRYSAIDSTDRQGISDEGFNLFGGVSFNGDFYFKAASPNPPKILATNPDLYKFTASAGAFNLDFDQEGTLHYMIVEEPTYIVASGSITTSTSQTNVTGVGTAFLTQLVPGSIIRNNLGVIIGTVASITSNTQLTLADNARINLGNAAYRYAPSFSVTNNQILGTTPYTATTVVTRGVQEISQVSPGSQWVSFNAQLADNTPYRVYVFAESNAEPLPIVTPSPYASRYSNFGTNSLGSVNSWTITLIKQTANTDQTPDYEVCANSSIQLSEPIIISEPNAPLGLRSAFATGGYGSTIQRFNLLLPTGYLFDVTKAPKIQFNGADFISLPTGVKNYDYINSTLLEIRFINNGSSSVDNIVISDLFVTANSVEASGAIKRFFGAGLNFIPNDTELAQLNASESEPLDFTNTFNAITVAGVTNYNKFEQLWIETSDKIDSTYQVTYIPDNFTDNGESVVRLIPRPERGDYGPTSFSGPGVTGDELVLTAVEKDAAFFITVDHTDMRGCRSLADVQYLVYDHTNTIGQLLKKPDTTGYVRYYIDGTKVGLIPGTPDAMNIPTAPNATQSVADSVSSIGLAGYRLIKLFANIPERTIGTGQLLDFNSPGWDTLVNQIPRLKSAKYDSAVEETFRSYYWEYSDLIDSVKTTAAGVIYPYNVATPPLDVNGNPKFLRTVRSSGTANGKNYFEAGSLGTIEYTGVYQSTADFSVYVPFKQEVELFVPAVPIIDALGNSDAVSDTLIYCENNAPFTLTGYPLATAGVSIGKFKLRDAIDTTIVITSTSFVDNANGTASFNPSVNALKNNYRTIRVEYTYQEIGSPAVGTGVLYIKVTPNPRAEFRAVSLMALDSVLNYTTASTSDYFTVESFRSGRPIDTLSYCEDNYIQLINTSYFVNTITGQRFPNNRTQYFAKTDPKWSLGDQTNPQNIVNDTTRKDYIVNKYQSFGRYIPTFQVSSEFGCQSTVFSDTLYVGSIPEPDFRLTGISTADSIRVTALTPIPASSNGVLQGLQQPLWNYGEFDTVVVRNRILRVMPNDTVFNYATKLDTALLWINSILTDSLRHKYDTTGHFFISLIARSAIEGTKRGCAKIISKEIIIVPDLPKDSVGRQHFDGFSYSAAAAPKRRWQTDGVRTGKNGATRQGSIWRSGEVDKDSIDIDVALSPDLTVWSTGLSGLTKNYFRGEVSYLYSSVYNIDSIQRPMVSFDYINAMEQNDGVAFEFSVDNLNPADPLKEWRRVGTNETGFEWYDRSGLASKPGSQLGLGSTTASGDYGWSNSDKLTRTVDWANARHSLTRGLDIPNDSVRIMFRFAFSSLGDTTVLGDEGFALDNFRIGDRSRVVLVESFFNTGKTDAAEKDVADFLQKDFNPTGAPVVDALDVGTDYIKLNYHVGFPTQDPFNLENPADPGSRALYYGISSTPNSRVDGSNEYAATSSESPKLWLQKAYDDRTLSLAEAEISLRNSGAFKEAGTKAADGSYYVIPNVRAIKRLSDTTVVHVVFAEKKIDALPGVNTGQDSVYYVVQKMAPSASGTRLAIDLLPGDSIKLDTIFFTPTVRHAPLNDMVAVVFLQNPVTRDVYQAAMVSLNESQLITAIDDPMDPEKISVYPNPADEALHVVLPVPTTTDIQVRLADQMGRLTHQLVVPKGEQQVTLQTGSNSAGVYILLMDMGNGKVARRKVIINHNE